MERHVEINEQGYNVRCRLYCRDPAEIQTVIVCCHGFAGHKENGTTERLADTVVSKYKQVAVFTFDWPCHGEDVRKKLCLSDCMEYLRLVIEYVRRQYRPAALMAYAVSFGGYAVLRYLSLYGDPFAKTVLRCPAVDMYDVLSQTLIAADQHERLQKGKSVPVGFDRKVEVTASFLEELRVADLRRTDFLSYADDLLVLQGTRDEIVPWQTVQRFCEDNVVELVLVEGADHRFQRPQEGELVLKTTLRFFGLTS